MRLVLRLFINAAALWAAAEFIDGISWAGSIWALLGLSLTFGLINAFIRPVLLFFSLPALLFTLGLFTLVINALMLLLTSSLASSFGLQFDVAGFWPAFKGALVVTVVSWVLSVLLKENTAPRITVARHRQG